MEVQQTYHHYHDTHRCTPLTDHSPHPSPTHPMKSASISLSILPCWCLWTPSPSHHPHHRHAGSGLTWIIVAIQWSRLPCESFLAAFGTKMGCDLTTQSSKTESGQWEDRALPRRPPVHPCPWYMMSAVFIKCMSP